MKIIIDPREAKRFARFLDERARDLGELNHRVSRRVVELGANGWRDVRYEQFLRQFDEATLLLRVFLEHAEKYADYLRRKAAPIERYLERR
ncbi:MAG: hypothetical protein QOF89_529 [Acidobacteriota bacterium]|jgi:hypothetical protein|nr:hypothetical protein [Acidobacteriota bacterium]